MNDLYEGCDHSHPERSEMALGDGFNKVLSAVEKAFKKLHKSGKYKPEDLAKVREYREVIRETNAVLSRSLKDNSLTQETLKRMREDVFLFSGLKTHSELFEASRQLLSDDGKIKPFNQFSQDVKGVKESHRRYLEAEYDFAVGSVLMADKWDNFGDSDRYNLQYRTADDDRVRDTHADLRGITLPKSDPFWGSYFPPNGWRCRCTTVQVLARNNKATDTDKAAKAGRAATTKVNKKGVNKLEIFRFNPGKEKVVFPPNHPYRKVQGAKIVKEALPKLDREKDYQLLERNERFQLEKERLTEQAGQKVFKELDANETVSIHMYTMTDGYYGYLNKFNRTGEIRLGAKADGFTSETLQAMTRTINTGLDKIPNKYSGTVYRGTSLTIDQYREYEQARKNKVAHTERGFMSTTIDKSKAFTGDTLFIVESKKGAEIDKLSAIQGEREVLFKSGQKFSVTNIKNEDGKRTIYMEEI